ncbi:MAG: HAD-IIIA family hydrolase [Bacteroidia bacterium]
MKHPELNKLTKVNTFVFDVDGVLTDGSILVTEHGDQLRSMNIKDGYALQYAVKQNYNVIIISGGDSEGVRKRLERLGVKEIHLGVKDKTSLLQQICTSNDISLDSCLYMGDDLPDLHVMDLCAVKSCPRDAVSEIQAIADIVSQMPGGRGAVRDIIEKTLTVQGKWH